ncbi:HAMP domain-containing sensor histidine kinase [Arcobacter sp. 15-2]|uniref:sensor histidine kinase n=1 Tax=Arcobacter sp. 15-2 TaxID=3374109 RepID=UPI00399CBCF4
MLKLHDIFLRKFLILFGVVFFVIGTVSYFWIKNIYIEQTKIDLIHNIDIFSLQVKDFDYLEEQIMAIKQVIGLRITIIDKNGKVIAESDEDKSNMDNHLNRTEILESKYNKLGSVVRYSKTIKKDFLYVSKRKILNNESYYIRMARDLDKINEEYLYLTFKVAILLVLFIIVFFVVALKISKKVEFETNMILDFLNNLLKQNKSLKIESNYSVEFKKITKILTKVAESLAKKDKQKSKYTAKLKLSNRQKDDIISAISHEFKNPIAVISGYSQTLLDDKDLNANIRDKFLDKIVSNSEKLTNMIDRLRLSIKLDEGKQPSRFVPTNITLLTKGIIDDLRVTYPSRDINLKASDLVLDVDETMMSIAITNLIENALKYSQDAVNITIDKTKFSVEDYGIGVSSKDKLKITDKFYRVSNNGWNNSMGVGLSLVLNILNIHNFKLDIQSQENEGSTFSIIF